MSRLSSAPEPPKAPATLRLSLRIGLSLAIVLMVLGTSTVLCGAFLVHLQDTMRSNIHARLRDIAALASMSVDEGQHRQVLSRADEGKPPHVAVQSRLQEVLRKVPELRFAYTMKRTEDRVIRFWVDAETDQKIATHVGDPISELTPTMHLAFDEPDKMYTEPNFYTDRWGTWLTGYAPVVNAQGKVECVVGVDIAATRIAAAERSAMTMLAPIAGLITTIVAFIGVLLSRRIIRPLAQLETDMLRVRELDLSPSTDIRSRIIEINRMRDTLDTMKSGLRSFSKYVPTAVVRELIRQGKEATLSGSRAELTVFFSDIQGFATYAETCTAEELTADLADYFALITGAILESGGTVDKYIGDAVMAFWGAPVAQADHAERALRASLAIQEGLAALNERRAAEGKTRLITRIGLATGEVVVGNFGYAERFNYTAMGDTVNLASRIEGLNKYVGTRILATAATVDAAQGAVVGRLHGRVAVKGKIEAVRIVEPLALASEASAELSAATTAWNKAYERYMARDFRGALSGFAAWAERHPQDEAARAMMQACEKLAANPPDEHWQATVVMDAK